MTRIRVGVIGAVYWFECLKWSGAMKNSRQREGDGEDEDGLGFLEI
jgi:hypothetical protein